MRKLFILRGAPASGKSTWVRENDLEEFTISSDNIRLLLSSPEMDINSVYSISQEYNKEVFNIIDKLLVKRMTHGDLTILDATNVQLSSLKHYYELAKKYRYRFYTVDFTDIDKEELKERNIHRGFRAVPNYVIDRMCNTINCTELSTKYNVITKEKAIEEINNNYIKDCNNYKCITVFGDIHGCYEPLDKYFKNKPFNKETLYVFTGDYIDRGIQNKEVLEFLLTIYREDNVILLEGNHDTRLRQYLQEEQVIIPQKDKEVLLKYFSKEEVKELTKNNIKSTEFIRNTIPQIEHINGNSLKDLCNHFAQLAVLDFNNKVYFITHGGVPELPTPKTPTVQLVRGVGKYEDLPELYKAWETNAPHNYVQIHAHRNLQGYTIPVDETGLVYNLCDNIEDGGYLRVLEITKGDIKGHYIKNNTYRDNKVFIDKEDIFDKLSCNKYIHKKHLFGDVYSFNFTRDAFNKGMWNKYTTLARGLFVDMKERKVIARGYKKFFNYCENKYTTPEGITDNMKPPFRIYNKENGFLGLVSLYKNKFLVCSKSTNEGPFAQMLRDTLVEKLGLTGLRTLRQYLKRNDVTIVFECIHKNDPHIIEYSDNYVVLLDIITNTIEKDEYKPYEEVENLAKELHITYKEHSNTIEDTKDLLQFVEDCNTSTSDIEGYVIVDTNNNMFKVKLPYYKYWKDMRKVKEQIQKGKNVPNKDNNVIEFMKELGANKLKDLSIIDVRNLYEKKKTE